MACPFDNDKFWTAAQRYNPFNDDTIKHSDKAVRNYSILWRRIIDQCIYQEIADELGCSMTTVFLVMKKWFPDVVGDSENRYYVKDRRNLELTKNIQSDYDSGMHYTKIAAKYEMSVRSVYGHLKKTTKEYTVGLRH